MPLLFSWHWFLKLIYLFMGFPGGSAGKESTCNAGDLGSIPGLGRFLGEGKGYPLKHSGPETSMDHGLYSTWGCRVGHDWATFTLLTWIDQNLVLSWNLKKYECAKMLTAGSHHGRSHPWQGHVEEPWRARQIMTRGTPGSARAPTPKPESVCLTILCLSPTLLTLTGGYSQPPFSGKNQLRALVNKSHGHDSSVLIQTPLMAF